MTKAPRKLLPPKKLTKEQKLAELLRANLKRRKERKTEEEEGSPNTKE